MPLSTPTINRDIIIAWLRSSVYLSLLSMLLFATSLLLFVSDGQRLSMLVALGLWLLAQYHGYRLYLDWALFQRLPEPSDPQATLAFDQALASGLNRMAPTQPRSLASRWQGCRRLWQRLGYCLALQALCLAWQVILH